HDDPRLPCGDPLALVAPFRIREPRMEERDPVAEPCPEAADCLRSEGDLRHEHDRSEASLERRLAGAQIDLGLAAPRDAVEQEMTACGIERTDDTRDRLGLRLRQSLGPRLAAEAESLHRRRLLLPPRRLVRGDELERPC